MSEERPRFRRPWEEPEEGDTTEPEAPGDAAEAADSGGDSAGDGGNASGNNGGGNSRGNGDSNPPPLISQEDIDNFTDELRRTFGLN